MSPRVTSLSAAGGAPAARGFVLVGVAMFVLVLTILGLSLFSLSGFEAQFFVRSNERSQAFNSAASGIERARFALMEASDSLQAVWQRVPGSELEHVVAVQGGSGFNGGFVDGDSTGLTNWNGEDIWIRSVARAGQARVELVARFDPSQADEFYKRLITARDIQLDSPTSRWPLVYLSGAIMLPNPSDADTIWNRPPDGPLPSLPPGRPPIEIHSAPLPLPELDTYLAQKQSFFQPWLLNGASHEYRLLAGVGNVGYFYRPQGDPGTMSPGSPWTVQENQASTIKVSGTAVWYADPGIDFLNLVTVEGDPIFDRLIIVARPQTHGQPTGAIAFEGGITSSVPVILVTDGKVQFDSEFSQPAFEVNTRLDYVCMYANRVQIGGPNPGYSMQLTHPPSMVPNVLDPIIDQLYTLGVLPTTGAGPQSGLTLVPGTWQERSASASN